MALLMVGDATVAIPLEIFVPLMLVVVTGAISFAAWIVTQHIRLATIQSEVLSKLVMLKETDAEHHERLLYLERYHPDKAPD